MLRPRRWSIGLGLVLLLGGCGDDGVAGGGAGGGPAIAGAGGTGGMGSPPAGECVAFEGLTRWQTDIDSDDALFNILIRDVAALPSGDSIVLFEFSGIGDPGFPITYAGATLTLSGQNDTASGGFVIRQSADGSVAWAKRIEGEGSSNELAAIDVDDDGNVFLAGRMWSETIDVDGVLVDGRTSPGTAAGFAAKLDDAGEVVWATSFGEYGDDLTDTPAISVSPSGELVVSVTWQSRFQFAGSRYAGIGGAALAGFDDTGAPAWSLPLPSVDQAAVAFARRDEGGLRALGHFDASFVIGAFNVTKDPAFGQQAYRLDISASGEPEGAKAIQLPTTGAAQYQQAVAVTPRYALLQGNGGTDDSPSYETTILARVDGDQDIWANSMETPGIVDDLLQDPDGRALVLGAATTLETCGVADPSTMISRFTEEGVEDVRVIIDNKVGYRRSFALTPNGDLLIAFWDRLVRTKPLPEPE
ncbi:MAG: hypothetical protein HOW73_32590 [Polyangiaceae bacterium]|nr:hypothetical protein [Polyangiaceae bacterium]